MKLPIPDFRKLNTQIDARLNDILHRALERDLKSRYPDANQFLYDLEHYIYHKGYGPTNETLGKLMRELFDQNVPPAAYSAKGSTRILEHTARTKRNIKAA